MDELRYRYYVTTLLSVAVLALMGWLLWLWTPQNSGEVASWVQAVGSIGAIVGSFVLGRQQAKSAFRQAMKLATIEKSSRQAAIVEVVRMAYGQAAATAEAIGQRTPHDARKYWIGIAQAEVRSALSAMDSIPIFELDSAQMVSSAYGIKSSLLRISREADLMVENYEQSSPSDLRKMQGGIAAEILIVGDHWKKIAAVLSHDDATCSSAPGSPCAGAAASSTTS